MLEQALRADPVGRRKCEVGAAMRNIRGSFLKLLEERIVVLRPIPTVDKDSAVTGTWTYGASVFARQDFQEIVGEAANQKIVILRDRQALDDSGIPVSEAGYRGNITPPNNNLRPLDLVIRIDKGYDQLYIDGIEEVAGIQQLELINRERVGGVGY